VSELRLFLGRDTLLQGSDCAWALLDESGQVRGSGNQLDNAPKAMHCRLVLAGDLVTIVKAPLPDLPLKRLEPLLPGAVEAVTLTDADALHTVLLGREGNGQACIAVLEKAWLSRVMRQLTDLGLHPDSALPEYLLLPWTAGQWTVLWRGDETQARLGFMAGMALDGGDPPVGLSLAKAQNDEAQAIKVLHMAHAVEPNMERWRDALGMAVEPGGVWDWRQATWPEGMNLLSGPFAPGLGRVDWRRWGASLAAGIALLVAVQFVGMLVDWGLMVREGHGVQQEIRQLAERALPAHAAVVDPAWQVREQLQKLRTAAGNPSDASGVGLLSHLSEVWPMVGAPQLSELVYDGGTLTLSLTQADGAWVEQFKTAAAARGLSVVNSSTQANGGSVMGTQEKSMQGEVMQLQIRPMSGN